MVGGIGEARLPHIRRQGEPRLPPVFPATQRVLSGHAISCHCQAATSPARSPKRASSNSTA
jgi:hypothetical protein